MLEADFTVTGNQTLLKEMVQSISSFITQLLPLIVKYLVKDWHYTHKGGILKSLIDPGPGSPRIILCKVDLVHGVHITPACAKQEDELEVQTWCVFLVQGSQEILPPL